MKKVLDQKFNLVEVTLCIGIVAVAITGVMALFPIGFNATRSAIGETYSAYAANQFLAYLVRNCNDPTKSYGSSDFWEQYIPTDPNSGISEKMPSELEEIVVGNGFSLKPGDKMIYYSANPGLYRIKQGTSTVTDFHATVRIWRSTIKHLYINNIYFPEIGYKYAVRFNVEVSWPVKKPYDQREKRYYCVEVFRQEF